MMVPFFPLLLSIPNTFNNQCQHKIKIEINIYTVFKCPNGRNIQSSVTMASSTDNKGEVDVSALRAEITKQAGEIRRMKAEGNQNVGEEVEKLKALRAKLAEVEVGEDMVPKWKVDKRALDDALLRRMFVVPSFEIYGGVSGLYDLGPPGAAFKENMLDVWRRHFVLRENMLQLEATTLTTEPVLRTSGHVDKFVDLMVKDVKTGECYRADKLLEDHIDNLFEQHSGKHGPLFDESRLEELKRIKAKADSYSAEEIKEVLSELSIKSPIGNELSDPFPFNLMFATTIGPGGDHPGYLRPETAQGIFVNFPRLLSYNNGRMPFAAAQVGTAYRNEIAPRNGLLRVREFSMAEIEHFVHPQEKTHPKISEVAELKVILFPRENQLGDGKTIEMTIGDALKKGIIDNETLGYFIGRTHLFLARIGIDPSGLRFRQHLSTEMAHYACDCWDAEILLASGWVECVGHADRACFDLTSHAKANNIEMKASRKLNPPQTREVLDMNINKRAVGVTFKKDSKIVQKLLNELSESEEAAVAFQKELESSGKATLKNPEDATQTFDITSDMVEFKFVEKTFHDEKYTPSVIEPSFGVGRLMEAVFQHTFKVRPDDEQRTYFSFPPAVAPTKVAVLPLSNLINKECLNLLTSRLADLGISNTMDDSNAAIGRRYARMDEIGIPFAITVDFLTQKEYENSKIEEKDDVSVTLRERDSTNQVVVSINKVPELVRKLCAEQLVWDTDIWGVYTDVSECSRSAE
eukprot:gb/GECG01003902.1/.p1 GENE.gb/GECG01003902.1/~~gb/GECG01003902.1/.p1  ORF type:complete len:749 (+),score=116.75 gb/GECG01003902.1/:1-2247(+)